MITLKIKHKRQDETRNPVKTHSRIISFLATPHHINAYHTYYTLLQTQNHHHHHTKYEDKHARREQTKQSILSYNTPKP